MMEECAKSTIGEKDPVCGMNVDPSRAKHKFEHDGKMYYFCCARCLEKFRAEPSPYLSRHPDSVLGMHSGGQLVSLTLAPAAKRREAAAAPAEHAHQGPPAPPLKPVAYVCPMCPEVRASAPRACPRCGMALEAEVPAAITRVEYTCPMHPEIVRPEPGSCPICGMALELRTITARQEENPELREMTQRFWISLVLTAPLLTVAMADMLPAMPVQRILPGTWLP